MLGHFTILHRIILALQTSSDMRGLLVCILFRCKEKNLCFKLLTVCPFDANVFYARDGPCPALPYISVELHLTRLWLIACSGFEPDGEGARSLSSAVAG